MRCYNVILVDSNNNEYSVGVCTSSKTRAMVVAEQSLLGGRHISAKAIKVDEVDRI